MSDLGNKKIMAENIRYYMALHDVTQTEICNTLKIKMPTFSDWVNAKTYPRIDKIELMANYFGISKSDLVEERNKTNDTIFLNKHFQKYQKLSPDNQQTVNNLIDDLSEKQKIQDEKFEAALQEVKEKAQRQALLIAYGGKNKIHEFTDEELAKLDKWIEEQKSQKLPK